MKNDDKEKAGSGKSALLSFSQIDDCIADRDRICNERTMVGCCVKNKNDPLHPPENTARHTFQSVGPSGQSVGPSGYSVGPSGQADDSGTGTGLDPGLRTGCDADADDTFRSVGPSGRSIGPSGRSVGPSGQTDDSGHSGLDTGLEAQLSAERATGCPACSHCSNWDANGQNVGNLSLVSGHNNKSEGCVSSYANGQTCPYIGTAKSPNKRAQTSPSNVENASASITKIGNAPITKARNAPITKATNVLITKATNVPNTNVSHVLNASQNALNADENAMTVAGKNVKPTSVSNVSKLSNADPLNALNTNVSNTNYANVLKTLLANTNMNGLRIIKASS